MDMAGQITEIIDYFYTNRLDLKFFSQVIPPMLVVLMFGMGMSLRMVDLTRVVMLPRAVLLGLCGQLLLLPLIALFRVSLN